MHRIRGRETGTARQVGRTPSMPTKLRYRRRMTDDGQDSAESFDEDMIGTDDPVSSDQTEVDFPPERAHGLPFADADVTDESFAERSAQEEPEVSAADIDEDDAAR